MIGDDDGDDDDGDDGDDDDGDDGDDDDDGDGDGGDDWLCSLLQLIISVAFSEIVEHDVT